MSKFKEILQSQFKHVYPDLFKKYIVAPKEIMAYMLEKEGIPFHENSQYSFISRFYRGRIDNIPTGVTYENLDQVKSQLEQIYKSIYKEVDKESKFYDTFDVIILKSDFEMTIYTDYTTKINYLEIKLRLDFADIILRS